MTTLFRRICIFLASGLGISLVAAGINRFVREKTHLKIRENWTGAGFFGTLFGVFLVGLGLPLESLGSILWLFICTLGSVWICRSAEHSLGKKDDQRIVLDEIIGFLWACIRLPLSTAAPHQKMLFIISAFVLFRVFDVFKLPWKKSQDLPGGWGIMADDVLAGLSANLILQIVIRIMM